MFFSHWNIGLDIQPDQVTALAIQRQRRGWKICHRWQHALSVDHSVEANHQPQEELIQLLSQWQKRLPANVSLRVGLPPHLVLRRNLAVPSAVLHEPRLGHYVRTASGQLFPEGHGTLAMDYQYSTDDSPQVSVTMVSQSVLQQWIRLFQRAGLRPDVFELMPGCLAEIMKLLPQNEDRILLHGSEAFWMWSCCRDGVISYGWQFRQQSPDAGGLCLQQCPEARERFFCSTQQQPLPPGFHSFQPFTLLSHRSSLSADHESSFTVAAGLALRQEDRL
ncbi:type IV pilus biogenesis protein PilM [Tatumella citrea]|uniref:Pilus assembly protein HofM n=1 Tax=Tatumella citrea TaxID=53336 RepID=A0A1Y0L2Z8_TATCI|nr:hypothetical protein [Tatumella citrea]ARU92381.1 hypothetical protein A7K98_00350 [Tatumella citrea]ARU96416.1 hypothetical protein A7K99_00350 [Tatumella citrea]